MSTRTRVAYAAAIVAPLVIGALMIPWRDELDQSTALILVVPGACWWPWRAESVRACWRPHRPLSRSTCC